MFLCFPQKRGWRVRRRNTGSAHKPLLFHVSVAPTVYHRQTAEGGDVAEFKVSSARNWPSSQRTVPAAKGRRVRNQTLSSSRRKSGEFRHAV